MCENFCIFAPEIGVVCIFDFFKRYVFEEIENTELSVFPSIRSGISTTCDCFVWKEWNG